MTLRRGGSEKINLQTPRSLNETALTNIRIKSPGKSPGSRGPDYQYRAYLLLIKAGKYCQKNKNKLGFKSGST